ncbi:MAG: CCA tRNA nucleotidyltransferase [Oscillospiraceae bacterium]|nr:CCA tRNA nucleotidyltransferase [Oscillospiraceae bacterium]
MPGADRIPEIRMPGYVVQTLEKIEQCGYEAYIVGGCVRDALLGRRVHDWDAATSAPVEATEKMFPRTVLTGRKYGTVTVLTGGRKVEVTTYRADGEYTDSRHPEGVVFVSDIRTDLERRDFTMNAMAMDLRGELLDPFGGREDIAAGLIRCVGDPEKRFSEDALRMLRAVRFSAQLGFEIESGTLDALRGCAHLVSALSAERVRDETEKTIMSSRPEKLYTAFEAGLYDSYLGPSEIPAALGERLAVLSDMPFSRQVRWCGLCAVLTEEEVISDAADFLHRFRLDSRTVSAASRGCGIAVREMPEERLELKRILAAEGRDAAFCAAAVADALYGGSRVRSLKEIAGSGECVRRSDLAVSGADLRDELGIPPGTRMGDILQAIFEHVLAHPEDNTRKKLLKLAASLADD